MSSWPAHRDEHPHHGPVRTGFDALLTTPGPFSVPVPVWASFLRLATNRRVFSIPTPRADAFAFLDAVCAQPQYLLLTPGTRHLALLRRVCDDADAVGDLVPDAVLAALALEHGCQVVTLDRDFVPFTAVKHRLLPTR